MTNTTPPDVHLIPILHSFSKVYYGNSLTASGASLESNRGRANSITVATIAPIAVAVIS